MQAEFFVKRPLPLLVAFLYKMLRNNLRVVTLGIVAALGLSKLIKHHNTSSSTTGLTPRDMENPIPAGLQPHEREVYAALLRLLPQRRQEGRKPPLIAVISDLAKDYDDIGALVVLKEANRLGLIRLTGYVANLMPARERARFARGALDSLGLQQIPVGCGLSAATKQHRAAPYEFDTPFMAPKGTSFEKGELILLRACKQAIQDNERITLLCISSLSDASQFAEDYPDIFKQAIDRVVLQGGYFEKDGMLHADPAAANNKFDLPEAEKFHKFLYNAQIPTLVFTKWAAYASGHGTDLFIDLADTKHPVGEYLKMVQVKQDLNFYTTACQPDPNKRQMPQLDQEWFLRNRSTWYDTPRTDDEKRPVGEEILPYCRVIMYDALAAIGAIGEDALQILNVLEDGTPLAAQCIR
ncbi:hypothetical protein H2203_001707 [Taxawa tesnikishii (nom. ined.)]|nr:hypothetical protein H2203_001707 [Dothideales sp. JES 119]